MTNENRKGVSPPYNPKKLKNKNIKKQILLGEEKRLSQWKKTPLLFFLLLRRRLLYTIKKGDFSGKNLQPGLGIDEHSFRHQYLVHTVTEIQKDKEQRDKK